MWVILLVVLLGVVAAGVWLAHSQAAPSSSPSPHFRKPSTLHVEADAGRLLHEADASVRDLMRQIDANAAPMTPESEREAARIHAETLRETERKVETILPKFPRPDDEPVTLGPDGGPTWMSPEEWAAKVAAYLGQGRTLESIREVAEYLERRGPTWPLTPSERSGRAARLGMVIREEYMSPEHEMLALKPGADGLPDAWLERVRDRLLVVTPDGWVNPRSRTAASRAGLWSFAVRGTRHHESAARRADFTPGAPVRLVREPDNTHDQNAIAVYAEGTRKPAGYVPRGYAKRLARLLDAGADMVAVSVRGSRPGWDATTPHVLAVERMLWDHLNRERWRSRV